MDNSLTTLTNNIALCDTKEIAKQVMIVCRAITPQFYKNLTVEEMKAERLSIELLTSGMDQKVIAEMCKRAINNYARIRSDNNKVYFDINYLITFYKESFNYINCTCVNLPKTAQMIKSNYDDSSCILTEIYDNKGETIVIKQIIDKKDSETKGNLYSSKFFSTLYDDISEINI